MSEDTMPITLCGREIRKVRGREIVLLHVQSDDLKVFTLTTRGDDIRPEEVGTTFTLSRSRKKDVLKRFWSWRTDQDGPGAVRGHTVTYHKYFGVQCWLHVEFNVPDHGKRNVAVLVAEGKLKFLTDEQIAQTYSSAYADIVREWPLGLFVEVCFDKTKKKHVLKEEDIGEVIAPSFPKMGTQSSSELRASPAG